LQRNLHQFFRDQFIDPLAKPCRKSPFPCYQLREVRGIIPQRISPLLDPLINSLNDGSIEGALDSARMNSHSDFGHEDAPQAVRSPVERLLADARIRLVETGTRNRLVHTPRGGKRTRSLPIIGAEADSLFDSLVRSNRAFRFLPANLEQELALEIRADYETSGLVADSTSVLLQTTLDEQKLEKRLLSIFRDAKTA